MQYLSSLTPQSLLIMILMPVVSFVGGLWLGLRWLRWMARHLSAHSIEVALDGRRDIELQGVPEFFPPRDAIWTPNVNVSSPDQSPDEKSQAAL